MPNPDKYRRGSIMMGLRFGILDTGDREGIELESLFSLPASCILTNGASALSQFVVPATTYVMPSQPSSPAVRERPDLPPQFRIVLCYPLEPRHKAQIAAVA